jgi:hypothetical protein
VEKIVGFDVKETLVSEKILGFWREIWEETRFLTLKFWKKSGF